MQSRFLTGIAGIGLLCACSMIPGSDAELEKQAMERIAQELRDPSSAQFRNVHVASDETSRKIGMVCGEINGKMRLVPMPAFNAFCLVETQDLRRSSMIRR